LLEEPDDLHGAACGEAETTASKKVGTEAENIAKSHLLFLK
jgi:hypothetical protein